jgi:hypothetical protein
MPSDYEICQALDNWSYGVPIVEVNEKFSLELIILFDHDYEFHILFREWDGNSNLEPCLSLWFIGLEFNSLVKRWSSNNSGEVSIPYAECGQIIQEYMEMWKIYSAMRGE